MSNNEDVYAQTAVQVAKDNPELAVGVGTAVIGAAVASKTSSNKKNDAYDNTGWDPNNANTHHRPRREEDKDEKDCCKDAAEMCGKCSAALPLRILVTMAGLLLIVAGCVDFAMKVSFTDVFINSYLILFGMLIVCLEWNKSCLNEWIQRKTFYWAIFMSRLWGRSFFYF
eukprot:UN26711